MEIKFIELRSNKYDQDYRKMIEFSEHLIVYLKINNIQQLFQCPESLKAYQVHL